MGCCGMKDEKEDEKRMRKTNKEIEKQIQKDKQVIFIQYFYSCAENSCFHLGLVKCNNVPKIMI